MIEVGTERRRLLLGYLAALGAAFCYGALALVARKIVTDFSPPLVATAFSLLIGTVILTAMVYGHAVHDLPRAPRRGWVLVALAGCASTWGVSFWFLALSKAQVVLVAPVVGTSPLVSIALTHVFLQRLERVTWRTVLGALLVAGGVAVVALGAE